MTQKWAYEVTGLVEIYIGVGMYFDTEILIKLGCIIRQKANEYMITHPSIIRFSLSKYIKMM